MPPAFGAASVIMAYTATSLRSGSGTAEWGCDSVIQRTHLPFRPLCVDRLCLGVSDAIFCDEGRAPIDYHASDPVAPTAALAPAIRHPIISNKGSFICRPVPC